MRIVFIHKYTHFEPLGILYLIAALQKNGFDCYFIDVAFKRLLYKKIREIKPDLICYSVVTGSHVFFKNLNLKLKKRFSFISLFGGAHCTIFPEFIYESGVDIICRGEGELAIVELAQLISNKKNYSNILNFWVKENGNVFKNPTRNLIHDLDTLPFVNRSIINKYPIYNKMYSRTISASRGCPHNCSFCYSSSIRALNKGSENAVRQRSVANVIEELKDIKSYNPKIIFFADNTLNYNKKWIISFLEIYRDEINIPFSVFLRPDNIDVEIVGLLKKAGCYLVEVGIECGNEEHRKKVLNRNISNKQIVNVCNLLYQSGIKTMSLNMFGTPEETIEMSFETIDINIKSKITYASSSVYIPLPKTKLAEYTMDNGYIKGFEYNRINYLFKNSLLNIINIKRINRIHYLSNIAVQHPYFMPLLKILIYLPFAPLYKFIKLISIAWNYIFIVKKIDIKSIVKFFFYRIVKQLFQFRFIV